MDINTKQIGTIPNTHIFVLSLEKIELIIHCSADTIDRGYLPVAKIHFTIDEQQILLIVFEGEIISISNLSNNIENYLGREVSIVGYIYASNSNATERTHWVEIKDAERNSFRLISEDYESSINLTHHGDYIFTGVIQQEESSLWVDNPYLYVTKIESYG